MRAKIIKTIEITLILYVIPILLFLFTFVEIIHIRTMEANKFLNRLTDLNWSVDFTPVNRSEITLPALAEKRLSKAPKEFIDFISSFSEALSQDETEWFLSYKDYKQEYGKVDDAFVWNTFEMDSLKYADNDMEKEIKEFWEQFIPFYMSVYDDYAYIAICVNSENYGKIYQGCEPEYETPTLIAENLPSFLYKFVLKTK